MSDKSITRTRAERLAFGTDTEDQTAVDELSPLPTFIPSANLADFRFEVSRGNVTGMKAMSIFGVNPQVGSILFEDLWDPGGVLVYPTANEQWEVISDSVQDDVGGTGVTLIRVEYMDDGYIERSENITMNGTTAVQLTSANAFRHVRSISLGSGSSNKNVGTIKIQRTSDSLIRGQINAPVKGGGGGLSLEGHHTVPAGFTDWLVFIESDINKNEDLQIILEATSGDNFTFITRFLLTLYQSTVPINVVLPPPFREKSDLKLVGLSSNTVAIGSAALQFIRTDNTIFPPP